MISPTRSRELVSGGLTALLAPLEGAQQTGPEAGVHPNEFFARVRSHFVTGLGLRGT
jgi:hypothetical protein